MIDTKFLLLVLLIGLTGWSSWWLFFATNEQENSALRQYFFIFLSGFAVFSVCLFLLTFLGYFHWQLLLAVLFGLFLAYAWRFRTIHPNPRLKFLPYLLACLVLGLTSLGLAKIDKPFESILWADDASVFIGAASKLAQNGSLVYTDPLVLEMSPHERSQLLNNRIPNDKTGNLIRFPGGVRLINASTGKVGFSFYHLFPAWLALGFQTLGNPGYLHLLALFSILTLITLYFLGESLAGPWVGASLVSVLFLFYPQSYFSKMPATEILSQLLFLSGLLILTARQKSSALSFKEQSLLGIIWGSLFLCRLESIYVLTISLIFVFSLVPYFSRNQKQWRPLILMLMLFGLLAIYYQILRGEYLYALTSSQISSNGSLVMLGIELLDGANRFTAQHVGLSHLLFAGACILIVAAFKWADQMGFRVWPYWVKAVSGSVFCGILLAQVFMGSVTWLRLTMNIEWISLYFTPQILLILFGGLTVFVTFLFWKQKTNAVLWLIVILFLVPAVSYALNPLIPRDQPWAIRRFVPVAFPLFFLLSFCGWWQLFRQLIRQDFIRKFAFLVLVFFVSALFYTMSRYLMRDSIYDGLIAQMHEIGRTIPPKALVILPESWAGIHLEIPLQYSEGIDTLLLPLDGPLHPNLANTIGSYLARESQHRPVVAMLNSTKDPPKLLRRLFDLKIRTNQLIQFMMIPRTRNLVFPEKSEMASIPCVIYDLSPRMKTPEKSVLSYNEPNVTFINFYDKENGFRWTNQRSTIENFSYTTYNKSISAVLSTMPAFSFYDHRSLELSLIINGQFSLQPFKVENGNYLFDIDGRSIPKITSVTIESRTFRPVDHHVNSDSRDLGVSFVELRFRRK